MRNVSLRALIVTPCCAPEVSGSENKRCMNHTTRSGLTPPPAIGQKRVVARLVGGLGNQFFIYAAAVDLADRLGARLELDTQGGFCRDFTYRREYVLDQFAVTAPPAIRRDCFLGLQGRLLRRVMMKTQEMGLVTKRWAFVDETSPAVRYRAASAEPVTEPRKCTDSPTPSRSANSRRLPACGPLPAIR